MIASFGFAQTGVLAPAQAQNAAGSAASGTPAAGAGGTVDYALFSGWKRYHANCSVCHGPDGLGGTFAPDLTNSLKTLSHDQFLETVVNGKQEGQLAMPAFGADPNVMCYIEDIYGYLKARSDGKIARGRPASVGPKSKEFSEAETGCMGL
jgi:methanol metabolism-related c-type cytochrome